MTFFKKNSDKDGCHEKHIEPYKTKVQKAIFSTQNAGENKMKSKNSFYEFVSALSL